MTEKRDNTLDLFGQLEAAAKKIVGAPKAETAPAAPGPCSRLSRHRRFRRRPQSRWRCLKPPQKPAAPPPALPPAAMMKARSRFSKGSNPCVRRPGMYIGGTDEKALHHFFAEVIDNAMDEAVAGHASFIEVELAADGFLTVTITGAGFLSARIRNFPQIDA